MGFDVDAWIEAAQPPTRAVKIYGRGDLYAAVQMAAVLSEQPAAGVKDDRLAGATSAPDRLDTLALELEQSARWLVVRGIRADEREAVAAEYPEDIDAYVTAVTALALVEPAMARAQVAEMRRRIGEGQDAVIQQAISDATTQPVDVGKLLGD